MADVGVAYDTAAMASSSYVALSTDTDSVPSFSFFDVGEGTAPVPPSPSVDDVDPDTANAPSSSFFNVDDGGEAAAVSPSHSVIGDQDTASTPSSAYVTVGAGLGKTAGPLLQDAGPGSTVVEPADERAEAITPAANPDQRPLLRFADVWTLVSQTQAEELGDVSDRLQRFFALRWTHQELQLVIASMFASRTSMTRQLRTQMVSSA